jgi:hypothetical protein
VKFRARQASTFLLPLFVVACQTVVAQTKTAVQTQEFPAEVFTVPELPLSVQQAVIVKTEKGLILRCTLSNISDDEMIGMRYSLVVDQPFETKRLTLNRSEGFKLKAFSTRRVTFQAPLRTIPKRGQRLVLMVDQALATHSIWEVVKARDALNAYLSGDYSVVPSVIKVANQIDAPLPSRIIY